MSENCQNVSTLNPGISVLDFDAKMLTAAQFQVMLASSVTMQPSYLLVVAAKLPNAATEVAY